MLCCIAFRNFLFKNSFHFSNFKSILFNIYCPKQVPKNGRPISYCKKMCFLELSLIVEI